MDAVLLVRQLGVGVAAINVVVIILVLIYTYRSDVKDDMERMVPPLYLAIYRVAIWMVWVCMIGTLYGLLTNVMSAVFPVTAATRPIWLQLIVVTNIVFSQLVYLLPPLLVVYMTLAVLELRDKREAEDKA